MEIFKMLSDIAAVLKKPSGNTSADDKSQKPTVTPDVSQDTKPDTEVQNKELRLTFKEAQQAGFQFCYTRKKQGDTEMLCFLGERFPDMLINEP